MRAWLLMDLGIFRTHHNIRELAQLIYDTAFSLKSFGSKELMLHQKVPASYLALEDVIQNISSYLKHAGSDPVLNHENFKQMVHQEMHYHNLKSFRFVSFILPSLQSLLISLFRTEMLLN